MIAPRQAARFHAALGFGPTGVMRNSGWPFLVNQSFAALVKFSPQHQPSSICALGVTAAVTARRYSPVKFFTLESVTKRMLIGMTAISSLLATSAFAADLPMRPYTKAPVFAEPVFNWTGFYLGGNIGYSWGRSSDTSTLTNSAGTLLFASTDKAALNGVFGGGQIGYNWQIQNFVWGLEADIQGTKEMGSRSFVCPAGVCIPTIAGVPAPIGSMPVPAILGQKIDWLGTVRGRAGVAVTPTVLLYATGGLAYGEVN